MRWRRPPLGTGREAGFTLIEVIVAMVIFVIVSGATVTILISALRTVKENSDRIIAANIARSQVEELRAKGPSRIAIGLTVGGPTGSNPAFTVQTTSNWTGIGQSSSACETATPGQNYLRIHVEVSSASLSTPEVIDTILQPDTETTAVATGAATIAVVDQAGSPVSNVFVTGTDLSHPTNSFPLTTGSDGCLFIPSLIAPATMSVVVSRSGYVASTPTGTAKSLSIQSGMVTPLTFNYAPAAAMTFVGADSDYPIPSAIPVSWQLNQTGASVQLAQLGGSTTGLWPLPSGFTAWAGSCADADPTAHASARQSFAFTPGGTTSAAVAAAPVLVRGLPANTAATARYIGTDSACTMTTVPIGVSNSLGRIRVGLPYGSWEFSAGGQTQQLPAGLVPAAEGAGAAVATANFTLADLDNASPSPTPTPTPSGTSTPATPDPSSTSTAAPAPTDAATSAPPPAPSPAPSAT